MKGRKLMNDIERRARSDGTRDLPDPPGRRQFLQGLAAAGALTGAGGLLSACSSGGSGSPGPSASPSATGAPRRGGSLKVGLTGGSGSDTLDPHKGLTYLDTARAQALYQPLLQLNTKAQTEFVLAEEISPHGSTSEWVIRLRPGVTFHDGKPLTAADVIFTLRRILTQKLTGSTPLGPVDVKGLKALDKHTVLVPMTSPYGSFLDQLSYWYYLYVVPVGFDPKQPVGTGPFKYRSFTPGQRSVFVRNGSYWKSGLPHVDTLTIIDFSDSASLQNALATGVIHGAGALEGPQITALKSSPGVQTVVSHTGAITPFTMRVDQAPFNETHWSLPKSISLYHQANATADAATRKQIEHEMQSIDFNQGGYIIPAFIDALDAYSTKITGYSAARVGQPLSDFDFEHYSFV